MIIKIEQCDNGAMMTIKNPATMNLPEIKYCFTFGEEELLDDKSEVDGFISMLCQIIAEFHMGYNDRKGKEQAVDVVVIHGDEYPCKHEQCEICKK